MKKTQKYMDGSKTETRCRARTIAGQQCEKPKSHNRTDKDVVHQAGPVAWRSAHPRTFFNTAKLLDTQAHAYMEDLGKRITPAMDTTTFGDMNKVSGIRQGYAATRAILDETHLFSSFNALPTTAELELAQWWRDTAEAEIKQTVAKAVEYGSTDLIDIGRSLARVAGREIDDATAAEWGIFFYLEGKLSRWRSALERGDAPSNDTLLDIGVYARMAQRIRSSGGWPGTASEADQSYQQNTYGGQ